MQIESIEGLIALIDDETVVEAAIAAQGTNEDLFQRLVGVALNESPKNEVLDYVVGKLANRYSAKVIASWGLFGQAAIKRTSALPLPPKTEYAEILGYVQDALTELLSPTAQDN